MSRPISRRVAMVAAVLGTTAAAAATVSACGAAQADASPSNANPNSAPAAGSASANSSAPTPAEVRRAKQQLDDRADRAPSSVTAWGIDPAIGLVVVQVTGGRTAEVERFLAGIDPRTLRVVTGSAPVRKLPAAS